MIRFLVIAVNNAGGGNVMVRVATLLETLQATIDRISVAVDRNNRVVKSVVKLIKQIFQ